jgi:hypothetical protein
MGIIDDPISGVLSAILGHILDSKVWQRVQLVIELAIAATISYFLAEGAAILAGQPALFAHGLGLTAAGVAMLGTFYASPNAKGLTLALPETAEQAVQQTPQAEVKGDAGLKQEQKD